jgi:hypothetical protein
MDALVSLGSLRGVDLVLSAFFDRLDRLDFLDHLHRRTITLPELY